MHKRMEEFASNYSKTHIFSRLNVANSVKKIPKEDGFLRLRKITIWARNPFGKDAVHFIL